MKRTIILFGIMLNFCLCAYAQQFDPNVLDKRLPGQLYVEPSFGYTFGHPVNFQAGFEMGYRFNFGLMVSGSGMFRKFYEGNCYQTTLDFGYQIWHFSRSYPYVSLGAGILTSFPVRIGDLVLPVIDYRLGYSVVLVETKLDLNFYYRGDWILPIMRNGAMSLLHSLNVSLKWYISSPYNTKHW